MEYNLAVMGVLLMTTSLWLAGQGGMVGGLRKVSEYL